MKINPNKTDLMFNLFNKNNAPADVKSIRETLLRAIKEELQKAEGGEGRNMKGINLFMSTLGSDKHIYEAAVYADEPQKFKDEVQRIADDFALGLPDTWELEVCFDEEFPPDAIRLRDMDAAIFIRTKDHVIQRSGLAYIRVLNGEAEQHEYQISSDAGKINIGREKKTQVADGFFRLNQIAFPGESADAANKYISRQHAHLEWDNDKGRFMLFADDGGIPPGNKIKIRTAGQENPVKLISTHIGHPLEEGDQIILGETAVIQFSYQPE